MVQIHSPLGSRMSVVSVPLRTHYWLVRMSTILFRPFPFPAVINRNRGKLDPPGDAICTLPAAQQRPFSVLERASGRQRKKQVEPETRKNTHTGGWVRRALHHLWVSRTSNYFCCTLPLLEGGPRLYCTDLGWRDWGRGVWVVALEVAHARSGI